MKEEWFQLSKSNIYFLFSYNIILLIFGILLAIIILSDLSLVVNYSITVKAIIGGVGFSLIGSTIFYTRKLYKACIKDLIISPSDTNNNFTIGVLFYFILRPIFAVAFSVLTILILKGSVNVVTFEETQLNEGFIYLALIFSFFGGYSAGKFLTGLEKKGDNIIGQLFEKF